jgi:Chromo (CHRromatin Organisation MOdifier) domain
MHKGIEKDIQWKRQSAKQIYDKRRMEAPTLERGDRVYLRRRNVGEKKLHLKTKKTFVKLDSLSLGPFAIEKKLGFDNYRLKLPAKMKVHPVFHVSRLEKTTNAETQDNPDVTETEYEVEKIVGKRKRQGRTEYLIKWTGYSESDDTWEPTQNLNCPEKVQGHEDRQAERQDSDQEG